MNRLENLALSVGKTIAREGRKLMLGPIQKGEFT